MSPNTLLTVVPILKLTHTDATDRIFFAGCEKLPSGTFSRTPQRESEHAAVESAGLFTVVCFSSRCFNHGAPYLRVTSNLVPPCLF